MTATTSRKYTIEEANALTPEEFVRRFGDIFEHSPWIAEAVVEKVPFRSLDEIHAAMMKIVNGTSNEEKLALIRAHPDLAGRLTRGTSLTPASSREQASAGLEAVDQKTADQIHELNTAYRKRFGFPFVLCARLNNVETILEAFAKRLEQSVEVEMAAALDEISKIARLRLKDLIEG